MHTASPQRSPWLRQLPPVIVTEVRRRRGEILAGVRGRVLDLDTPGALDVVDAAGSTSEPVADDERYDTIVSTCRLIEAPDLQRAASGMVRLLAPGGTIELVEPVNRAGVVGLLLSSAGSRLPTVRDLHVARDVPRTIRAAGVTIIDLERFTIPTAVWPLRRFVQARAAVVEPSPELVAAARRGRSSGADEAGSGASADADQEVSS